jgi:O-antigen/teichoic acid export membrane protein
MKRSFVIGASWTSLEAWVEQILNLIIFVVIARLIGTEAFGLASMALAFVLFAEVFVRDTLTEGIIERHSIEEGHLEATFFMLCGFGLLLCFALLGGAPLVANFYGEPSVTGLMLAASPVVFLIACSGVSTAILRRNMAFRILAIRSITGVIVGGAVGIYLAVADYGAWSLVGQRLTLTLVNSLIAIVSARWWPKRLPQWGEFALIGGLGPRVVCLRATKLVMVQAPTVILGSVLGPQAVAVYALTWRLVEALITLIVAPIRSVAQSTIAIMRRKQMSSDEFFLELIQVISLASFIVFVGLALIGDPVVVFVFGADWEESVSILPWICLVGAIQAITEFHESYLMAYDSTQRYLKVVIAEAIVCVAMLLVASSFGIAVVAAALVLRAVLFLPIHIRIVIAPEQIVASRYARSLLSSVVISLTMLAVLMLWRHVALGQVPELLYLVLTVLIGALVSGLIVVFLTPGIRAILMSFVDSVRHKEVRE